MLKGLLCYYVHILLCVALLNLLKTRLDAGIGKVVNCLILQFGSHTGRIYYI